MNINSPMIGPGSYRSANYPWARGAGLVRPAGQAAGMTTSEKALLIFAAVGLVGFVYFMRPESEAEKRQYQQYRLSRARRNPRRRRRPSRARRNCGCNS